MPPFESISFSLCMWLLVGLDVARSVLNARRLRSRCSRSGPATHQAALRFNFTVSPVVPKTLPAVFVFHGWSWNQQQSSAELVNAKG
ncbi:hypothetical protein PF005_g10668 [Phytophthora fragariae]|uniref:Uncharacterized protein n=2 Tax=Phytophthora TaxID=4783 RepID=A0A6A3WL19_9STRA|nr:hypothetical protein PF003_g26588 [Phytophthora fragariae]KAE8960050.1 hypothetical protein PR001_g30514 [Phytophthora rubi]KAE8924512.1 hypothetical protein PF009_g25257 [Phytophthora fragariae]KAE8978198.1 hypothetical protein PF011_g23345 [Phytophthora fragariae]KAE8983603.1 hypothetical protein PR002_g23207 [Phytophthora rubi]